MVQVESEAILEIEYDSAASTLFVRFTDGDWYSYFGVPSTVHRAFLGAASHGRFFHDTIRSRYRFRKGR
jgi:hypothetical protein